MNTIHRNTYRTKVGDDKQHKDRKKPGVLTVIRRNVTHLGCNNLLTSLRFIPHEIADWNACALVRARLLRLTLMPFVIFFYQFIVKKSFTIPKYYQL